jgi:hypothetical protein
MSSTKEELIVVTLTLQLTPRLKSLEGSITYNGEKKNLQNLEQMKKIYADLGKALVEFEEAVKAKEIIVVHQPKDAIEGMTLEELATKFKGKTAEEQDEEKGDPKKFS